jgi:curved DNA-binding protein
MGGAHQEGLKMPPWQTQHSAGIGQRITMKILTSFQKSMAKRLGILLPENGRDLYDILRVTREDAAIGGKVRYLYAKQADPRELLVTVPQGISSGQKIKLKGMGEAGRNGGESGDLYLKVRIHNPLVETILAFFGKLKKVLGF